MLSLYFLNHPAIFLQDNICIVNILTYPASDVGGRKRYHGQAMNGKPHGVGVLFYNQSESEERERYEGKFR